MEQKEVIEKAFRRLIKEFTEEKAEGTVIQVMGPSSMCIRRPPPGHQ
jgi:hypothetical protein